MEITVNGEARDTPARTVGALWAAEVSRLAAEPGGDAPLRRGYAVALNGEVVRAARWDDTELGAGDRVEIIRAFAGG